MLMKSMFLYHESAEGSGGGAHWALSFLLPVLSTPLFAPLLLFKLYCGASVHTARHS